MLKLVDKVVERFGRTKFSENIQNRGNDGRYSVEQHRKTILELFQLKLFIVSESKKMVSFNIGSIMSFTSLDENDGLGGGSNTATKVLSSGKQDVIQQNSADNVQKDNNSLSDYSGTKKKTHKEVEFKAMN